MVSDPAAGVDGCRAGWIVAVDGEVPSISLIERFEVVMARLRSGALAAVGVDMPIGLTEAGPRSCDVAARAALGPRRASVFPSPIRAVLECETYQEALAVSRATQGKGLSKQAWNLVPKIREVDEVVRAQGQQGVAEVHPELAFASMFGQPLPHPKREPAGRELRVGLVREIWPKIGDGLLKPPRGAAADDVLDALAVCWLTRRMVAGGATRYGLDEVDTKGLRMEVWG